ncbi:MAG: hypothetical protein P4N24_20650, partial [Acidobacteriota bacterium]|nr:hypothetical protein [Acidobacteriota bacterium]
RGISVYRKTLTRTGTSSRVKTSQSSSLREAPWSAAARRRLGMGIDFNWTGIRSLMGAASKKGGVEPPHSKALRAG